MTFTAQRGLREKTQTNHCLIKKIARIRVHIRKVRAILEYLAEDGGLEPPNAGIKIQCLTDLANPLHEIEIIALSSV